MGTSVVMHSEIDADEPTFGILHALRIKGLASESALSTASGIPVGAVRRTVDELERHGLMSRHAGRITGVTLTGPGHALHDAMLKAQSVSSSALPSAYERFVDVNCEFKSVCTAWQLGRDGKANDDSDAPYDRVALARLDRVHDRVTEIVSELAVIHARFARYGARLNTAVARVRAGDSAALLRPLSDSYHDIWMELHHDLRITIEAVSRPLSSLAQVDYGAP
jgi:DNA-binding MarR family transcriptional regulator